MGTPSRVAGSNSSAAAARRAASLSSGYGDGLTTLTLMTRPLASRLTITGTSASIPCALRMSGYAGLLGARRLGMVYVMPAVGMRLATWLAGAVSARGVGGASLGTLAGASARLAVAPARVLPTANEGPSPPSEVD